MAMLVPELDDVLATLEATSMRGAAQAAREAIQALPQPDLASPNARAADVEHQFNQAFQTLLRPLKLELEASQALADLADQLDVAEVKVVFDGEAATVATLTGGARIDALAAMVQALGAELGNSQQRAQSRTSGQ
jgi:hypothetical protein